MSCRGPIAELTVTSRSLLPAPAAVADTHARTEGLPLVDVFLDAELAPTLDRLVESLVA